MGKGEIAHNDQFLHFPQRFLPIWTTFCHFHQTWNCRLSVSKSLKLIIWERVNSLPNNKILDLSKSKAFADNKIKAKLMIFVPIGLKTFWEKEKMLVTSIFSFSRNVFQRFFVTQGHGSPDCVVKSYITLTEKAFGNIVENAGNQDFFLFPQCFLPQKNCHSSNIQFLICIIMLSIWCSPKFCHLIKG